MTAPKVHNRPRAYGIFFAAFLLLQLILHLPYLQLPYFWDELGQFIPAALDIWQRRAWVPVSTTPNVHPPGVMAYLAAVWSLFGYSVLITRVAMLLVGAALLFFTFLLAIQVYASSGVTTRGAPAFAAVALLAISPLVISQSMMAQLDMPAAAATAAALFFFLRGRLAWCVAACCALVLAKETGALLPGLFLLHALRNRRFKHALLFLLPPVLLGAWLLYLRAHTGTLLGDRGFEHYNLWFQLHPVRLPATVLRRLFYLFVDNFHVAGTLALLWARRHTKLYRSAAWLWLGVFFTLHLLAVSVLGGAALERYLLPLLPILYIAIAGAWAVMPVGKARLSAAILFVGFGISNFINPPWPYPFENNLSVVDFVNLQAEAAKYVQVYHRGELIASAWPFPDALRRPEFGYVTDPMRVKGIDNFNRSTIRSLKAAAPDVLVVYSRTWEPSYGILRLGFVERFLASYYFYEPQATGAEIERELQLTPVVRLERNGQWVEIYAKHGPTVTL